MTAEDPLTLDEFMTLMRPEIERQADELILAQPPEDRRVLMQHREAIVEQLVTATRQANERHRAMPWLAYRQ
jgi:hypothetical protein